MSSTCLPPKPSRLPRRKRSVSAAPHSTGMSNSGHFRIRSCGPEGRGRGRAKNCNADPEVLMSMMDKEAWRSKLLSQEDIINSNRSSFNINLNSMTEHLCAVESVENINLCNSLPVYLPSKKEVMNESNEILAKILSWLNKDQVCSPELDNDSKNISEVILNDNFPSNKPSLNFNMWHSVGPVNTDSSKFDESLEKRSHSSQQLGAKVEMVYNLLSMLSTHDREEMTRTLLVMTRSPDSCVAMRKSGCLPLLVQLLHGADESPSVKQGAAQALRNIVHCHTDDKQGRREARVLRLLDQVRIYYEKLSENVQPNLESQDDSQIGQAIAALMKLSFDEEHRHAMCQLGALQTISTLIQVDHRVHGSNTSDQNSITLRRYAGMTMTNLTFGDGANKSLLCSMPSFMTALVSQLESPSEDLRQVTASVLRNLSWRANEASKTALREVSAITALVKAAMRAEKESTLKSILSALWNFSAHSKENKADICAVEGCLEYLIKMLTYQAPSKTLSIIENAGGILRNVSSYIAMREDYREILRENNCLAILLQQLRSPSLTVVSNACGTLWNFSAHSEKDQRLLWDLGAVPLLRSLVHSKHKMISVGSSATLKNLLAVHPEWDPYNKANKGMPGLSIRKRKAFEQELDVNLSETCDNIEVDERWDENTSASKTTSIVTQYAETDLDQPTNYSLRYAEDDTSEKIVDQEVPRTYYTEGTPCNISSATSVSDLRPSATDGKGIDEEKEECNHTSPAESLHSIPNHPESQTPNEVNDGKNVILETPLMFSRASSLDSVSTPPDHPDDRSSVVSEFSRITSGMISPSELPDSPTQTIPPSPQSLKPPVSIPPVAQKPISMSVFEDTVASFKEESTPVQFSTATSLSSLTFDDDIKGEKPVFMMTNGNEKELAPVSEEDDDEDLLKACIRSGMPNSSSSNHISDHLSPRTKPNSSAQIPPSPQSLKSPASLNTSDVRPIERSVFEDTVATFKDENTPVQFSSATSLSSLTFEDEIKSEKSMNFAHNTSAEKELAPVSEEEDEEALKACIKSGMPSRSTSSSQICSSLGPNNSKTVLVKPCQRTVAKLSGLPVRTGLRKPASMPAMADCGEDTVKTFCTEDTPANISHAASHSDLSMLCASSDDGSDYENILAECIQSGMPQSQRRVEPSPESKYPSPKHKSTPNDGKVPQLSNRPSGNSFNSPRTVPLPRAIVHPRELREVAAQDEMECFATEGSPCNFSAWSSLSDLTVNSKNEQQRPVSSPVPNNESPTLQSLEHTVEDELTVISKQLSECQMKDSCDTWNDDSTVLKPTEYTMKESCGTWDEDSTSLPSFTSPLINKSVEGKEASNIEEKEISTAEERGNKPPIATITPFIENHLNEEVLTDSRIIELEAGKITIISSLDMEHSMSSMDLESVKPPSIMSSSFSMTSSITENGSLGKSNKMRSILVRRALGDSISCNIESTKPPSFLDEANLVDLENSIVSVASIVSEVVDSPPLSLTEDITVTDNFTTANDMTDSSTSGRTTPKHKRNSERDRYNTYTIQPEKNGEESNEPEVKESQNEAKKVTPKQRRQTDKDRFLTRTIGDGDYIESKNETPHIIGNVDSKLSPKQKRSANKDRYLTRTLSRDNSLGSDTLVPIDNDILDPDTVTNISDYESEEEPVVSAPKPKVLKPVKVETSKSSEMSKSAEMKGSKKSGIPTFVNKMPKTQSSESVSKPIPKTQPSELIVSKSTLKTQSSESVNKSPKNLPKKDPATTPAVRPTKLSQPLQRQGTFTKEKPTTPVSGIPVLSPKTASGAKKIPTKIASLKSPT